MTDKLQIELVGAGALVAQLNAAISSLEHPRELLEAVGAELEGNVELRFRTKKDASGAPWQPIGKNTAAIYEKINKKPMTGTLLERTGHMRDALTHNATDAYVEVGFGPSAPYAGYHVTGTRKMPRRDPLFGLVNTDGTQGELGAGDTQDVLAVVEDFLRHTLG